MRVLWVVPRFGRGILGGAESLVRGLAECGARLGWNVEVATTCARDHRTWSDELPAGVERDGGVVVRRFPVGARDIERQAVLHRVVLDGRASYLDELEWLSQSVWSEGLQAYLEETRGAHDLRLFSPYLFGTTLWGVWDDPGRSALMPCLHDEPYAHLATVRRAMEAVRGCFFNAPAEERLARRLYAVRDGGLVGMGYAPPVEPPPPGFAERHGLGPYLLYAGRLEEGKRVQVAVEHVLRLSTERRDAPQLALMGAGDYRVPAGAGDRVVHLGFLEDDEKRAAYAEALALVNPSHMESLSLVLMEAWREGTPGLVAAGSAVMREHVERSGGGIAFADYTAFRDGVARLTDGEERARMGARGRAYVLEEYGWPAVTARMKDLAERLAA
jgi:glycosyltransferase involved in cell wall biosynthesis